jgi:Holliday junction DNA helicase RuvA
MISFLEGTVIHIGSNYIIVQTGGVGYKVFATPDLLTLLPGKQVRVFTYHRISDDDESLFGMATAQSLEFFELLISVSGVGPKIALAIISAAKIDVLQNAIANQDASFFSQMSGVGKKTAERIIVELKSKMASLPGTVAGNGGNELFTALSGLGYSAGEIRDAITKIDLTLPMEQQLKAALNLLSKR